MEAKFETGQLVLTHGVFDDVMMDPWFSKFVGHSFEQFRSGDWGDISEEDRDLNDYAVEHGERLMGVYKDARRDKVIWIITEWDRSTTTILYPDEY